MSIPFGASCWHSLCGKWPELTRLDSDTARLIIEGALDAHEKAAGRFAPRVPSDYKDYNGIPPHLEEVRAYLGELHSEVVAEEFFDFYSSKGWKVGTVRMKDWRAACRLWNRRQGRDGPSLPRTSGQASLFALQSMLKTIEQEMNDILYPAGSAFKVPPSGTKAKRFETLSAQRRVIMGKIDGFAA